MEDSLRKSITGRINISAVYGADGVDGVTASWEGGDIVGVTKEFLEGSDPEFVQQEGDIITICQFRLQLIGGNANMYLAQRIDED